MLTTARKLAPVFNVLGKMVMLLAVTMLFPLLVSDLTADAAAAAFHWAMGITFLSGLAMTLLTMGVRRELTPRDGYLLASLTWIILTAFAALPLLFQLPDLSLTDAYFEAMSGLSTTGATVLTGLDDRRTRSTSGATSSTGWAAWGSSSWPWRSSRYWASAADSCSRPKHPVR
jgi:trk system potassium uptake protein TrkH